jgi:phosphoribosylanthranilate isomerase
VVRPGGPLIKICGLGDVSTTLVAIESGATTIGFMLAESRRQVSPQDVATILEQLPPDRPPATGVTVNLSPSAIQHIVMTAGIDIVQLSGDESIDILDDLDMSIWKAFRFAPGTTIDMARAEVEPWVSGAKPVDVVLIDAAVPGRYGGTGHRADWTLVSTLAELYPVVLAGGLSSENVAEGIGQVRPMGVDVSSGVEVNGKKSPTRIREFIATSKLAFENSDSTG